MATAYRVEVYYRNIDALFQRGGPGNGWMNMVARRMLLGAQREAPRRSGALVAGHRINRRGYNQYRSQFVISNVSDHADYVHEGTKDRGPIRSTRPVDSRGRPPAKLLLRPGNGHGPLFRAQVRGQKANPWLDRAATKVAVHYGAVPYALD